MVTKVSPALIEESYEVSPYVRLFGYSFSTGYTITSKFQLLLSDNKYWSWQGEIPEGGKVVQQGSSPLTSGGLGNSAWVDKTGIKLREELASPDGTRYVSHKVSDLSWAVSRSLQDVINASCIDLSGVLPSNIQQALDSCYALSEFSVVKFPKSLSLSSGLIIEVDKVKIIGPSVLDFSAMESAIAPAYNYAITLTSSSNPPYHQVHNALDDIEIIGPDMAPQTCGILYSSQVENSGVSHIVVSNINLHGFSDGEMYANHAYIITHHNFDSWGHTRAILHDVGYNDYGERIGYVNSAIYNNEKVLDANNPNGGIHFINCSIDYNTDFGEVDAGYVKMTDCHMELVTYTSSYLKANGVGAAIDMIGGWLLCTGTGPHNSDSFAYASAGASVRVYPTKVNNLQNTYNRFGKGDGFIDFNYLTGYSITENPSITSDNNNLLSDGSFESSSVVDDVFIYADTAAISSRVSGTNINLVTSTDTFKTGTKSLKATKIYGAGSPSGFIITTPITRHSRVGIELNHMKLDTASGTMYITYSYASGYKTDQYGVPSFAKYQDIGTETVTVSGASSWFKVSRGEPLGKSPAWATHVTIRVNMDSLSAGSMYFDDVIITC